ncbi:MAG: UDP-N-acetylmuramoyl-L-alanine--D-glutamate ligase, partial [Rhodothermales bacterium]
QLDDIEGFRPRVSVLLNITPDHLDRYEHDLGRYQRSKFRVFENQGEGDTFIYNFDDPVVRERTMRLAEERPALEILGFSQEAALDAGAFLRGGEVVLRVKKEEVLMRAEEISLQGRHNLYNTLAAAVAARVMEVRSDAVRESLMSFEGVPHRLEFVRELDGVRYVNDSKATNVNAVWYALESFREPVVLIAGGRDKGNDYSSLKPLLREKARAVIAIGESASKVAAELGPEVRQHAEAETMEDALRYARLFAEPGDVVLLSPACASFDMFENYEERGEVFKRLVNDL